MKTLPCNWWDSAWMHAIRQHHLLNFSTTFYQSDGASPLIQACCAGSLEHVKLLLQGGADIMAQDEVSLKILLYSWKKRRGYTQGICSMGFMFLKLCICVCVCVCMCLQVWLGHCVQNKNVVHMDIHICTDVNLFFNFMYFVIDNRAYTHTHFQ
jgi:hypothetical protein